jgi:hypothetical protein
LWLQCCLSLCLGLSFAASARADAPASGPRLGGHLGIALPIATIAQKTTVIGGDFVNQGITPGITLKLDDRWAVDFEFIAFNAWRSGHTTTTLVVDPGVVYRFDALSVGTRVATEVGAPRNVAIVPIFVKPFKISDVLAYFVELDLPLFFRDDGSQMKPSLTVQFQTGFGFWGAAAGAMRMR